MLKCYFLLTFLLFFPTFPIFQLLKPLLFIWIWIILPQFINSISSYFKVGRFFHLNWPKLILFLSAVPPNHSFSMSKQMSFFLFQTISFDFILQCLHNFPEYFSYFLSTFCYLSYTRSISHKAHHLCFDFTKKFKFFPYNLALLFAFSGCFKPTKK